MATAKVKKVTNKPVAKRSSKKIEKKQNSKKVLTFNAYSIYFQSVSIILAIAAITLNLCNCISMNIMLDLFGLSVMCLAFSLFPKRSK